RRGAERGRGETAGAGASKRRVGVVGRRVDAPGGRLRGRSRRAARGRGRRARRRRGLGCARARPLARGRGEGDRPRALRRRRADAGADRLPARRASAQPLPQLQRRAEPDESPRAGRDRRRGRPAARRAAERDRRRAARAVPGALPVGGAARDRPQRRQPAEGGDRRRARGAPDLARPRGADARRRRRREERDLPDAAGLRARRRRRRRALHGGAGGVRALRPRARRRRGARARRARRRRLRQRDGARRTPGDADGGRLGVVAALDLSGRVAVVTGASRGIGRAIALDLAARGAAVACASRDAGLTAETAREITDGGGEAEAFGVDVRSEESIEALADAVLARFRRVDILVNNAGIAILEGVADGTRAGWQEVLDTNLTGPYLSTLHLAGELGRSGHGAVVNVGSLNGVVAMKRLSAYCASKGGLHHLTRQMALDLAEFGVRVNGVAPGFIQSDMFESSHPPARK